LDEGVERPEILGGGGRRGPLEEEEAELMVLGSIVPGLPRAIELVRIIDIILAGRR
jgi:hypothetical protein